MSRWWRAVATTAGGQRSAEATNRRSYFTIQAIPREVTGSRVSSRDRAQGRIPAIVFSQKYVQSKPNDPTSIIASSSVSRKFLLTTERKQIKSILNSVDLPFFYSTTFPLQIRAGSGSSTLLESGKVHKDEETGKILNLVFVWAEDGTKLKVDVPVVFQGEQECPGLKKGGYLNKIRPTLKFLCPAEHIPQKIEVDVSQLDVEDKVSLNDIDVHPTWKLLSKNEIIPVCKVKATTVDS
ncbi:hypothetical protein RND71_032857 [Anisodus tanguticus]|uniref:Large ribosomal subunit protein bL25 beta domain-containing protein n=1 Tax=Anisodus tanguticus TaxID=243964 RepID=A0AAE1R855_9SOLA|nr:hypothetical protein RND71_032857 [Anisodus tanguticus]